MMLPFITLGSEWGFQLHITRIPHHRRLVHNSSARYSGLRLTSTAQICKPLALRPSTMITTCCDV